METSEQPRRPGRPRLDSGPFPQDNNAISDTARINHARNVERGIANELKRRQASVEFMGFEYRPRYSNNPKKQNLAKLIKVERVNATGSIHRKILFGKYPLADAQRLVNLPRWEAWKLAWERKWTQAEPPDAAI